VDGECTECSPDSTECAGAVPRVCSSSGTWVSQAPCQGDTPVCEPDTAECLCEEDTTECADTNTQRRCIDGQWESEDCGVALECDSGEDQCDLDTIATPGVVSCDATTKTNCADAQTCCGLSGQPSLTCQDTCVSGTQVRRVACDGDNDCEDGSFCCASDSLACSSVNLDVSCRPDGFDCNRDLDCGGSSPATYREICNPQLSDADCPSGTTCLAYTRAGVAARLFACQP
jgi:hypothetical protein